MNGIDPDSLGFVAAMFIGTSILLIVISIPMMLGRVKPNRWYGARTRKTLADESVWYDVNAHAGKGMVIGGIVLLVASILLALLPGMTVNLYTGLISIVAILAVCVPLVVTLRAKKA